MYCLLAIDVLLKISYAMYDDCRLCMYCEMKMSDWYYGNLDQMNCLDFASWTPATWWFPEASLSLSYNQIYAALFQ